jgi:hypothetical protein
MIYNKKTLGLIVLLSSSIVIAGDFPAAAQEPETSKASLETFIKQQVDLAIKRQCAALKVDEAKANKQRNYMIDYAKQESIKTPGQFDTMVASVFRGAGIMPGQVRWCGTCNSDLEDIEKK